jgi:hypothetical protein
MEVHVFNKLAFVLVALVAITFTSISVNTQAAPVTGTFVSALEVEAGPQPFLSLVVTPSNVLAYICDGETVAQWYLGTLQAGGLFEARSTDRKSRITAQINAGSVVGAISLEAGRVLTFRAISATAEAGLYRSSDTLNGSRWLGGWVVLPDGQQRGAVIGSGSTRPGRKLEFAERKPLPYLLESDLILKPFQVTPEFVGGL